MKFKIKRILSVLLVFCMMMGIVPNMAMDAHAAGKTTVTQIELTGVYLPKVGNPCSTKDDAGVTTPSDAAYEFSPQYYGYWDAGGNELTSAEKFEPGLQYYTEILIRIKSDTHAFSADSKPTITFTDLDESQYKSHSVSFIYIDDDSLRARISFTMAGDNAYAPIDTLVLDEYKAPVNGQYLYQWYYNDNAHKPNHSTRTYFNYLKSDGTQYGITDSYSVKTETGKTYGLVMEFEANENYSFADTVNISVASGNPTITYEVSADKKTMTVKLMEEVPGPDITSIEFGLISQAAVINGNTVEKYADYWVTESSDKYYAYFDAHWYEWKDEEGNIVTEQKFENGKNYTGQFDFRAETGHSFASNPTVNVTSGGKYVSHKVIKNIGNIIHLEVTVTPGEPAQPPVTPPATTYTITATAGEGGTVTQTGSGTYNDGAAVTVAAIPNTGYEFVEWKENGAQVSTDAAYTFIVEGNRNLVAVFKAKDVTPEPINSVNLTDFAVPSDGDAASDGDPVATAESGKGYTFAYGTWFDSTGSTQFNGEFEAGETYIALLALRAEEGYKFAPTESFSATVNNGAVTVNSVSVGNSSRENDTAYVKVEFTVASEGGDTPAPTPTVSIPETLELTVGDISALTATVTDAPESYTLVWSSSDASVATVDQDGNVTAVAAGPATITVELQIGATRTTISDTCVVTVTEPEIESYTVDFDTKGGSAVESQTIEEGGKVTKPADPTKEGFNFIKWTFEDKDWDFDYAVTGNMTLVAVWEEVEPEVPETVTVAGTKTWVGDEEADRPESIIVNLLANGEVIKEAEVTARTQWTFYFDELPKYDEAGAEIEYSVEEEAVEGYTATYDGYNITNTLKEEPEDPEKPVYGIVVNNGKSYAGAGVEISAAEEGTKITLKANAASEGKEFDKWVVNNGTITLADATKAETTFDMPAERVEVTATYKDKVVTPPADDDNSDETDKPSDDNKEDESKPSDTNKPATDTESPKTGDTSNIFMWFAVLFVSGFALVGFTLFGRKRRA